MDARVVPAATRGVGASLMNGGFCDEFVASGRGDGGSRWRVWPAAGRTGVVDDLDDGGFLVIAGAGVGFRPTAVEFGDLGWWWGRLCGRV